MPGAARQQVTLFCIAQNISNQTKGHPPAPALRASLDFPGESGGCVKLGLWPQTNTADGPRFTRKTEAVQRGIQDGFVGEARVLGALPDGEDGLELVFLVPLVRRRVAQPNRGISARTV